MTPTAEPQQSEGTEAAAAPVGEDQAGGADLANATQTSSSTPVIAVALGVALLAALAGVGAFAWTRRT